MSDTKISQDLELTELTGNELFPVVVNNSNISAAACIIKVDGVTKTLITAGTLPVPMLFTTIGTPDTTYLANGAYGEVLVYEGALTAGDATLVRDYLRAKWGTP